MKERMKERDKDCGAVIVEVAVIVPLILMVVMGCMFLLFFFLDMGSIHSETIHIANEVALEQREENQGNIASKKTELASRLKKKLIITKVQSESIQVSLGTVTVKATVSFPIAGETLSFSSCSKAAVDNREDWIRLFLH